MTLQEPQNPPIADVDMPDTEVIVVAHPSPVFVDSTGRRSRMLRRVAYGFGALCMVYGGLVSVSLAGGPVSSSAVLPLPDLADGDEEDLVVARPSPAPEPVAARTSTPPILEVLPRRGLPVAQPRQERAVTPRATASSRPARTPAPRPTTKKPTTTTPKPVESATTKPTTPTTTPTSTEPTPPPIAPVPPVPPAPPAGGGQGGGGQTDGGQGSSGGQDGGGQGSGGGQGGGGQTDSEPGGGGSGGQGGGSADEQPDTKAPEAPAREEPVPPAVTSPVKVSVPVAGKPAVTVRVGAADAGADATEEPEPSDGDAA
ncbi:hypothetical protein [Actinoplanes auranticolor]|uniref:Uncharacterized protein n=1 Tax=Actinoplanes auranticolor TaxID=47988 RepID=A0A919S3D9_9ACTN|nr:hypothetical protein [Actinoplanes auranticolor]GIM63226.1 hypothetical protein Aau02nite_02670 [Actinoplanes auranticolor]